MYSEFLRTLRERPKLLAHCLTLGDRRGLSPRMGDLVCTVFSGLYGSCLMREDEELVLRLLHHLMRLQLREAPNPRKLLRQGNCSFSRLYKVGVLSLLASKKIVAKCLFFCVFPWQAFNEELFSAKLFLTSALYEPILALLTDAEIFLDIDPSKAIIR